MRKGETVDKLHTLREEKNGIAITHQRAGSNEEPRGTVIGVR
jgi:hypothetical protein